VGNVINRFRKAFLAEDDTGGCPPASTSTDKLPEVAGRKQAPAWETVKIGAAHPGSRGEKKNALTDNEDAALWPWRLSSGCYPF